MLAGSFSTRRSLVKKSDLAIIIALVGIVITVVIGCAAIVVAVIVGLPAH
jgi:hypothetical protein